jgi:uncharacterized protein (TIGR00730 family)
MPAPIVTIFGSSAPNKSDDAWKIAHELGVAIARQGWTVCNGGYGGTMHASAEGAVSAGGHTIGVTCRIFRGRSGANPAIRQEVPTFDLFSRLNTLLRLARAYVVLPGSTGTLLELAAVLELAHKNLLRNRLLVLLGDWWTPVVDLLFPDPAARCFRITADIAETIACLSEHLSPTGPVTPDRPH